MFKPSPIYIKNDPSHFRTQGIQLFTALKQTDRLVFADTQSTGIDIRSKTVGLFSQSKQTINVIIPSCMKAEKSRT